MKKEEKRIVQSQKKKEEMEYNQLEDHLMMPRNGLCIQTAINHHPISLLGKIYSNDISTQSGSSSNEHTPARQSLGNNSGSSASLCNSIGTPHSSISYTTHIALQSGTPHGSVSYNTPTTMSATPRGPFSCTTRTALFNDGMSNYDEDSSEESDEELTSLICAATKVK